METKEEFIARMDVAKGKAFAEFLAIPKLAAFLAKAPRPELREFLSAMLEAGFNAGVSFGVGTLTAELEDVTRTEL